MFKDEISLETVCVGTFTFILIDSCCLDRMIDKLKSMDQRRGLYWVGTSD